MPATTLQADAPKPSLPSPEETGKRKSRTQSTSLPTQWIERIFERMSAFYGSRFSDTWGGVDPEAMKRVWGEELAGYHSNEIRRGLSQLHILRFPPTLPEFLQLCRPVIDPETAFIEAVRASQARERGGVGTWSNSAVYWAAIDFGMFELRQASYRSSAKRWEFCLSNRLRQRDIPPIPEPMAALQAPGQSVTSPAEAREHMARIRAMCVSKVVQG